MDPISPELVLVDPELARRARAGLPDRCDLNGRALRAPVQQPTRALRLRFLVVAGGLFLVLLGVLIRPIVSGGDPAPETAPAVFVELPRVAEPTPQHPSRGPRRASQILEKGEWAVRTSGRAAAKPTTRPRRSAKPAAREEPIPAGLPPAARTTPTPQNRVETRLFVWLPRRGAGYYNVRFFKGARTIYEAWPTDPRVTVPMRGTFRGKRFAFTNGPYRWMVRPAFGSRSRPRYGAPIVRSVWAP
jgi:hypothetical protein